MSALPTNITDPQSSHAFGIGSSPGTTTVAISLSSPKSKSGGYTHSGPDPFPCTQGQVKTQLIKATGSRDLTSPSSPAFPHTRVPSPQGWKPGAEKEGGLPTAIPLPALQGGQLRPRRAHHCRGARSWQVSGRTWGQAGLGAFTEVHRRSNWGFMVGSQANPCTRAYSSQPVSCSLPTPYLSGQCMTPRVAIPALLALASMPASMAHLVQPGLG